MSDVSLTNLMSRDFVLLPADSTVEAARAAVPLGHVAVVMQGSLPVGILTEDRLLGLEDAQQSLAHYADRYLTATLTLPNTPLADILQAMIYGPSVRWHVVVREGDVREDDVLGVITPHVLLGLLSEWVQRPPDSLPKALQTLVDQLSTISLGTLLKLPGDPIHPSPTICGVCPATDPPHALKPHDLDYTNLQAPTCKRHKGTPIVWLNPCP